MEYTDRTSKQMLKNYSFGVQNIFDEFEKALIEDVKTFTDESSLVENSVNHIKNECFCSLLVISVEETFERINTLIGAVDKYDPEKRNLLVQSLMECIPLVLKNNIDFIYDVLMSLLNECDIRLPNVFDWCGRYEQFVEEFKNRVDSFRDK